MLASLARFGDDSFGLEKALRLCQAVCTTVIGLTISAEVAAPWVQARQQLALGRRYFRLLKWHPCWVVALEKFDGEMGSVEKLLEVGKWSFLGLYFFVEMPTMSNAMGITDYSWGSRLQDEANKCWFYAISFSIVLSIYQLLGILFGESATKKAPEKPASVTDVSEKSAVQEKTAEKKTPESSTIYIQLVIDCCDLLIPGSSTGWIPVDAVAVGVAQSISSMISIQQIWNRLQGAAG